MMMIIFFLSILCSATSKVQAMGRSPIAATVENVETGDSSWVFLSDVKCLFCTIAAKVLAAS